MGIPPQSKELERVTHEDMTAHLIRHSEIAEVIDMNYRGISSEDVIAVAVKPSAVLGASKADPLLGVLHEILTWDFGTDRMDFLLRDAHHSGQPTGIFDFRKLLDSLVLIDGSTTENEERGGVRVGIDGSGWLVAEQMVVARYLMYVALYFHKTKRAYEKHVERYLPHWTAKRFDRATLPVDVTTYSTLTDSAVMADVYRVARTPKQAGHRDCRPFIDRSHFRVAKELVLADNALETVLKYTLEDQTSREVIVERDPDRKRLQAFTQAIQQKFDDDVMVDTPDHSATKMFIPGTEVLVALDGKVRYLGELSEIVRGMPTRVWRSRVYAPLEQKDEVRQFCDSWLEANRSERITLYGQYSQ